MTYEDYLKNIEGYAYGSIERLIKYFEPIEPYKNYVDYCKQNGLKYQNEDEIRSLAKK